jgi:hypothetical protein
VFLRKKKSVPVTAVTMPIPLSLSLALFTLAGITRFVDAADVNRDESRSKGITACSGEQNRQKKGQQRVCRHSEFAFRHSLKHVLKDAKEKKTS